MQRSNHQLIQSPEPGQNDLKFRSRSRRTLKIELTAQTIRHDVVEDMQAKACTASLRVLDGHALPLELPYKKQRADIRRERYRYRDQATLGLLFAETNSHCRTCELRTFVRLARA
jgi:hypothetical protein